MFIFHIRLTRRQPLLILLTGLFWYQHHVPSGLLSMFRVALSAMRQRTWCLAVMLVQMGASSGQLSEQRKQRASASFVSSSVSLLLSITTSPARLPFEKSLILRLDDIYRRLTFLQRTSRASKGVIQFYYYCNKLDIAPVLLFKAPISSCSFGYLVDGLTFKHST